MIVKLDVLTHFNHSRRPLETTVVGTAVVFTKGRASSCPRSQFQFFSYQIQKIKSYEPCIAVMLVNATFIWVYSVSQMSGFLRWI
eukprot:g14109.t1